MPETGMGQCKLRLLSTSRVGLRPGRTHRSELDGRLRSYVDGVYGRVATQEILKGGLDTAAS